MEPRKESKGTFTTIINGLKSTREQLGGTVDHYFSEYANEHFLWEDRERRLASPVDETDPPLAQFSKHSLLALQDLEEFASMIDEYNSRGYFGQRIRAADTAYRAMNLLYNRLRVHLQELTRLAKEAGLPEKAMSSFNSIMNMDVTKLSSDGVKQLTATLPKLNESFSDLVESYFNSQRPAAPETPETKYQVPGEVNFKVVTSLPTNFDRFKADTYFLVKEENKKWRVVHLDRNKKDSSVDFVDVWGLETLLGNKSPSELKEADDAAIKAILANRWMPSVEDRSGWFKILLAPMHGAARGIHGVTDVLSTFITEAKLRGEHFDAADEELIKKTKMAFEKSELRNGFWVFTKDETVLSQSVKAIFNLMWAVNQLGRGFWENPSKIGAYKNLTDNVLIALDNYWKIDWPNIGGNIKVILDQLVNAMLIHGKDTLFPKLSELSSQVHETELQHHLRYGALLDRVRPLFDQVEAVYVERGIAVANPFGSNPAEKERLEAKAAPLKKEEDEVKQKNLVSASVRKLLQQYAALGSFNPLHKDPLPVAGRLAAAQVLDPTPTLLNVWISPVLKAPRQLFGQGVEAVVSSTVSFAEGLKRNFLNFPRVQLLQELSKMRKLNMLKPAELSEMDDLEDYLIGELTLEQKRELLHALKSDPDLLKKIAKGIGKDKKRDQMNIFSRVTAASGEGVAKALAGWPPVVVKDMVTTAVKVNQKLAKQQYELQSLTEAQVELDKQRNEYAIRTLEKTGLNSLISAITVSLNDPKVNLAQKRQFAVILADLYGKDRAASLLHAHEEVSAFIKDPAKIKKLILDINKSNPDLGHVLAIESMIAGYVHDWENPEIMESKNPAVTRQDLLNVLDRIEAQQIFTMIDQASKNDLNAANRYAIFKLLLAEKTMSAEQLSDAFAESDSEYSKTALLASLVDRYKQLDQESDRELKNKIGHFIGRLARADIEVAKIVFQNDEMKTILENECLIEKPKGNVKSDRALFYESWVNVLDFDYAGGRHEEENRDFKAFLEKNRSVVLLITKAMDKDESRSDDEIIKDHSNDPWAFAELTERFIKTRLSHGSDAETKLREFFSAAILCCNNQPSRDKMLKKKEDSLHSVSARFLELLTVKASYKFWAAARVDLIEKPGRELFRSFDIKVRNLERLSNGFEEQERIKFMKEVGKFINAKKAEITSAVSDLKSMKQDFSIHTSEARQLVEKTKQEVDEKARFWEKDIKDRANIRELDKQLGRVDESLTEYLDKRGIVKAALLSALGYKLRMEKITVVTTARENLREMRAKLAKARPDEYKDYATLAINFGKSLDEKHKGLTRKESEAIKQDEKQKIKDEKEPHRSAGSSKQGKLGSTVSQIQVLLDEKRKHEVKTGKRPPLLSELQDDLPERMMSIGKIFLSIVMRLSAWMASKPKVAHKPAVHVAKDVKHGRSK